MTELIARLREVHPRDKAIDEQAEFAHGQSPPKQESVNIQSLHQPDNLPVEHALFKADIENMEIPLTNVDIDKLLEPENPIENQEWFRERLLRHWMAGSVNRHLSGSHRQFAFESVREFIEVRQQNVLADPRGRVLVVSFQNRLSFPSAWRHKPVLRPSPAPGQWRPEAAVDRPGLRKKR